MEVIAHMDPCFTLISGWLIVTIHRLCGATQDSFNLASDVLRLRRTLPLVVCCVSNGVVLQLGPCVTVLVSNSPP
jgi:peptidoglycan/LPS O-acetylase OafA/YrhL